MASERPGRLEEGRAQGFGVLGEQVGKPDGPECALMRIARVEGPGAAPEHSPGGPRAEKQEKL